MELHRRMGHIALETARKLVKNGLVTGVRLNANSHVEPVFCESCVYAKVTRKLVAKVRDGERAKNFGDDVHSDVWGPAPVETLLGRQYYVSFTDDATREPTLFFLKKKLETFTSYKSYQALVQTQHGTTICSSIRSWWRISRQRIYSLPQECWNCQQAYRSRHASAQWSCRMTQSHDP